MNFYPEGINKALNKKFTSAEELKSAVKSGEIFEGRVTMCDGEHNLYVDLGAFTGIIPKNEGALGILEKTVRDIALITKVNKSVCFRIMGLKKAPDGALIPVLSRRNVQLRCMREYVSSLREGDIINARVTRLEGFGAFIDIGCGINSLIPIDMLSVSRINHPKERLYPGEVIRCALKKREDSKLTFTLKELLGTWEENACRFVAGETVTGVVRSVESYGVFVELAPNLAGLAEPLDGLCAGQRVTVYIKSINNERMKIKLAIIEAFNEIAAPEELKYFVGTSHINRWSYSPAGCLKVIETVF